MRAKKTALGMVAVAFALLSYLAISQDQHRIRGRVRGLLCDAKEVIVREYAEVDEQRQYSELLTEKRLTAEQAALIRKQFHWVNPFVVSLSSCNFEPHHQFVCRMRDESEHTIHICFKCSEIAIDDRPYDSMEHWEPGLRRTLEGIGIPVRDAEDYRFASRR